MQNILNNQILHNTIRFPNLWGCLIPINVFGLYAIYLILSSQAPGWWLFTLIIGYFILGVIGIGIGYHRLFSHRSFKTYRVVRQILLFFGIMAGQGSPIFWAGIHRGHHHRYTDKIEDTHSPMHGFWHSYILWLFRIDSATLWGLAPRSILDLVKDKDMMFYHKHYIKIFIAVHVLFMLVDINVWLFGLVLPTFLSLHSWFLQTSITHCRSLGYRNFNTKDNSVNIPWIFPLALGDAWHNNHHGRGKDANMQKKWWELDPSYWIIKVIEKRT